MNQKEYEIEIAKTRSINERTRIQETTSSNCDDVFTGHSGYSPPKNRDICTRESYMQGV